MPIINPREGNPRWGFLDGFGAAPAVPLLLADPKTGAFSNSRFEELKGILISAKSKAESDFQALLKRSETGIFSAQTVKEAAAKIRKDMRDVGLPRLQRFQSQVEKFYSASYDGWNDPNVFNAVLRNYQTEIERYADDAQILDVAWNLSFYVALFDRAKEITNNLYRAGAGVIEPVLWFTKNLPWILGVGAVLLIAGPTIAGALTGGRQGAARAFESDVRSARGVVASGARGATRLLGSPKRRRRR